MTAEQHLEFLLKFLHPLYRIIEEVIALTQARFETEKEPIELWYFCDSVRYGTKTRLKKLSVEGFSIDVQDINNNGLEILLERDAKHYCVKVYKSVHGLLPAPGKSFAKQAFWEQASLFPNEAKLKIVNLAVTYHVDGYFNMLGLDLCRPVLVAGEQTPGQNKWSIPIPHPATAITAAAAASPEDLDSYDQRRNATDDEDDLDITVGKDKK